MIFFLKKLKFKTKHIYHKLLMNSTKWQIVWKKLNLILEWNNSWPDVIYFRPNIILIEFISHKSQRINKKNNIFSSLFSCPLNISLVPFPVLIFEEWSCPLNTGLIRNFISWAIMFSIMWKLIKIEPISIFVECLWSFDDNKV